MASKPIVTSKNIRLLFGVSCVSFFLGASMLHHQRQGKRVNMATHAQWLSPSDIENQGKFSCTPSDEIKYKAYGLVKPQNPSTRVTITPQKTVPGDGQGDVLVYTCKVQEKTLSGSWKTRLRFMIKKSDLAIQLADPEIVNKKIKEAESTAATDQHNKTIDAQKQLKEDLLHTWQRLVEENTTDDHALDLIIHGKDHPTKTGTLVHTNRATKGTKLDKELILPSHKKEFLEYLKREKLVHFEPGVSESDALRVLKFVTHTKSIKSGREIRIHESVIREGDAITVYGAPQVDKDSGMITSFETQMLSEEDDDHFTHHLQKKQSSGHNLYKAYVAGILYLLYELFV